MESTTELGRQFSSLANSILARKQPDVDTKKRFVEYFSILPGRYAGVAPEVKKTAM